MEGTRPRYCSTQSMTARVPNADNNRNIAVLIPSSQITAGVKGGKLNVISRPRPRKAIRSDALLAVDTETHLSGKGTTGRLRWPSASTALTAKMTLSLERFNVECRTLPHFWTCSHSGLVVAR